MNLTDYLEEDREKLTGQLEDASSAEEAQKAVSVELEAILYRYNEDHPADEVRQAASWMLQVLHMASPLLDCAGSVETWTRTCSSADEIYGAGAAKGWGMRPGLAGILLLIAAAASGAGGALYGLSLRSPLRLTVSIALLLVSALCFFLAGTRSVDSGGNGKSAGGRRAGGRGKAGAVTEKTVHKIRVDGAKVFWILRSALQIADQNLEQARDSAEQTRRQIEEAALDEDADSARITLLSDLLEAQYSGDGEFALERLSDIRYYLYRSGIDIVDYTPQHEAWFDRMPAPGQGTIRPALVREGRLLRRGMAAGGAK